MINFAVDDNLLGNYWAMIEEEMRGQISLVG